MNERERTITVTVNGTAHTIRVETRTLLVDAGRRASLGTAAQAHAGNFTWRAATSRMLGLLRRAASGAPPVDTADDGPPGGTLVPPAQRAGTEPGGLAPDPLAP